MSDTKELECVDFILRADAMRHPALEAMVNRLNDAYRKTEELLTAQSVLLKNASDGAMSEAMDVKVKDVLIEAVWNECFDALERMVQPSGKAEEL